ncbi:MAG: hypothetical protein K2X66_03500 [Cyanobacteria bacterium]|nr:hypothetical protein [Cyanobacteriota bacterium]
MTSGGESLIPQTSKSIEKTTVSLGNSQEKLNFTFEGQSWEQVENKNYGNSWRITYIPQGETLSTTPESFSYQFLERKGETLRPINYYKGFVKDAESQSPEFRSALLTQSKEDVLFQWDVLGHPGKQDFRELQRFIVGPKGYHIIRYSYRGQKITESQEKTWRKLLQKAKLESQ